MYLMFVDESGDTGLTGSPTGCFVLSGLVIHESRWQDCLERLIRFRRRMRHAFGLKLREEIHSRHMITVVVDKTNKPQTYDVFEWAWGALIQRFENTIRADNFPGPGGSEDRGILIPDRTDEAKLSRLMRRMRRHNPIPNQPQFGSGYRDLLLTRMVEDPSFRESHRSYFIQAADTAAFLLYQREQPCSYFQRKGGHNYFSVLRPVLLLEASSCDPDGVVRL